MRRLIIVGEAPGKIGISPTLPGLALTGNTGRHLADIAGWPFGLYLAQVDRRNLFYDVQPKWDVEKARAAARRLEASFSGDKVILMGTRVAEAFGAIDRPLYEWWGDHYCNFARIPHTSGRNRVWNDPAERARARAFLKPLI